MDLPTDYEELKTSARSWVGRTGRSGRIYLHVDFAKYFMEFIQNESCGKCIPCREGTRRMLEILEAITRPVIREPIWMLSCASRESCT